MLSYEFLNLIRDGKYVYFLVDDNELGFAVLEELVNSLAALFAAALATIVCQSFEVRNVVELHILFKRFSFEQFTCFVFY